VTFADLFRSFQHILALNNKILELMADMGEKLGGDYVFDRQYILSSCRDMAAQVYEMIYNYDALAPRKHPSLDRVFRLVNHDIEEELAGRPVIPRSDYVLAYEEITDDLADGVGGKNIHIAEIRNRLGLTVPEGFAITTRSFRAFFEHNRFQGALERSLRAWEEEKLSTAEASGKITAMIASGRLPPVLIRAMEKALKRLRRQAGGGPLMLAVRSSAMGEDSEHTFAGQYVSLLNEAPQNLAPAYMKVLAGAYSPLAMEYRRQKGITEHEVAMAVACQGMIDAKFSGVLYTLDPLYPAREIMTLSSAWGLGAPVVGGEVTTDRFLVSRQFPYPVQGWEVARKTRRLTAKTGGGCEFQPVAEAMQTRASLSEIQIRKLAEAARAIERYFKCPQDIEWAFDQEDRLHILQARPLNVRSRLAPVECDIPAVTDQYPIVFSKKGIIVQNGIAAGKVFVVRRDADLERFPNGAILVARETSPRFAKVARKAAGIITDTGSSTGHMAAIAREFRIPTIVNAEVATRLLQPLQEITLDAQENIVYAGRIKELCYLDLMEESFEESYEYRLLRRVLKKITPLNLVDPHAKNFRPEACRSYHDITRFIHEKAVEELANFNFRQRMEDAAAARKLKSDIPLDLVIIDISDGLNDIADGPTITQQQVHSIPMRAFLAGLSAPGVWSRDPMSVDFSSFMSSLTRTFAVQNANPQYLGQNLAVISAHYANINLRLGYHFNMIDAYVGDQINDNYAYFRFLGGVTDPSRRSRRARFIYETLSQSNFNVDLRGDLVIGRIKKLERTTMENKMYLLGQLVGFTRQLDVKMTSDQQIHHFVEQFALLAIKEEPMKELERQIL
jgi:pyruvate,water dikinase